MNGSLEERGEGISSSQRRSGVEEVGHQEAADRFLFDSDDEHDEQASKVSHPKRRGDHFGGLIYSFLKFVLFENF